MTQPQVAYMGFALLVLVTASLPVRAQEKSLTEERKIEALLKHVGSMKDATFIRNGKEYDPQTSEEFLRRKWKANRAAVGNAKDFIEKVASISSTSGKPYLIRLGDGKETKSGDYLLAELRKLEKPSTDP